MTAAARIVGTAAGSRRRRYHDGGLACRAGGTRTGSGNGGTVECQGRRSGSRSPGNRRGDPCRVPCRRATRPVDVVCLGLAGFDRPEDRKFLAGWADQARGGAGS